ncbi:MAG: 5'/3'-nucleotidase SurE [Anaerolineaceae bacterium]|nr:5'/3'-nucleotidase SurE [Anaerolineaceae bacterium]
MKNILVTNDDGVTAPGLLALALEMTQVGKVTVLAPDRNWSASGHAKTLHKPLRVKPVSIHPDIEAYNSDGAPSDCVSLALMGALDRKFDMVVSGINPNANIGHDITYSGTVTAAMEATIRGVFGIAVSLDSPLGIAGDLDYSTAAKAAKRAVLNVFKHGLPKGVLLNINVPYLTEENLKGFSITRQGLRIYHDELVKRTDPRGKPYFWIGGEFPTGLEENQTDYGMMKTGYVSITPLHLDLSAYSAFETLTAWDWNKQGG